VERRVEAKELSPGGEGHPLFLPTPSFMRPQKRSRIWVRLSLCSSPLSFPYCYFLCHFFGALAIFLGQAWVEGKGELATCRLRADNGRAPGKMSAAIVYIGKYLLA
jgi:hypothetical protein